MYFYILCFYLLAGLVTFFAYGWDKRSARRGTSRTSEKTLHLLELIGGWPGAILGQHYFRHKWKKAGYMRVFWIIVAVHIIGWIAWFIR